MDHSDSKRENPLPSLHGLHFPISRVCCGALAGWNEKLLNESTMKDKSDDPSHHERMLLPWL